MGKYNLVGELVIHKDSSGEFKKTTDGKYRFDMLFKREGEPVLVIRGFRVPVSGIKMLMPASTLKSGGMFQVIQMEAGFEKEVFDFVKSELGISGDNGDEEEVGDYFKKPEKPKQYTDKELENMDLDDVPNELELRKRWDKIHFPDSN